MATSILCNILQLFDYLCHYSHGHLLSIRLGIRCLSCSITFWLSQTCCFLFAQMHSCYSCTLIIYADCHMFNYCFPFHTSPLCNSCLMSSLLINTLCLLYTFPCSHLIAIVHQCLIYSITVLFLHMCTLCSLHASCILYARSAMHSYCPMHTHCLLTTLCALVIHSTLVTSSSPVASASCWLYAHSLFWAHFFSLIVHPALCIFTICNTILVWGILVVHHTLLAHRCSLYYVQSQFSLAHHFIPNYLLLPDTHSLFYMPFSTYVLLSLCPHFLFCVHFRPCACSLPNLCPSFMLITSSF